MPNSPATLSLSRSFGEPLSSFLQGVSRFAEERFHAASYLVGGAVRDALLGKRSADIDIMIQGDALALVKELHAGWSQCFPELTPPKKPILFKRYGTAKLPFSEPLFALLDGLDFSSSRSETYPEPGAPPEIQRGGLYEDLARRDFSINALAVEIRTEEVIDFFSGCEHLQEGKIEILHEQSFRDDPARLLRACRFLSRFEMSLGERTKFCFSEAIAKNFLRTLPPRRKFDEFVKLLSDVAADVSLRHLVTQRMLPQIHEFLSFPAGYEHLLERKLEACKGIPHWQHRFALLTSELDDRQFYQLVKDFNLSKKAIDELSLATSRSL